MISYSDRVVTLKHLRYFEALSRQKHFGRAADECAVTQPALSMKVQELEAEFGVALVERRRGDIRLTDTGEEVARRARNVLASVRDLTDFARHTGGLLTGRLVLGAIPSIAPYLLPAVLPLLRARHPGLELTLRETQTAILVGELLAGSLDAVLLSLPIEHPDIATLALFDDPFVLATRADAALPAGPLRPEVIAGDTLLLLEDGHCLRDQALAHCSGAASDMRGQFGATSLATVVQLVANGYGVTLLPQMAVAVEVANDPRIAVHRFAAPEPTRSIGLAWRRTSPQDADFRALGEILVQVGAE